MKRENGSRAETVLLQVKVSKAIPVTGHEGA
jgi:hypothetical protein